MRKVTIVLIAYTVAACQAQPQADEFNGASPAAQSVNEASPAASTNDVSVNGAMPVPPGSLPEPTGPIDPKSSEAAGQVVQHYGALIEQGKFAEAAAYWGSAQGAAAFAAQLKEYREVHLSIGDLGEQEGAAGSIYITEPVTFYGKTTSGSEFSRKAVVTLRRVNDVPGSTEAQRRWHIQSIDWS